MTNPVQAVALKVVRSHVGYSRLLQECSEIIGYIPRQTYIPSPYASSPTEAVYEWNGRKVFFHETAHKVYQMFEVPAAETITTDEAATEVFIARLRAKEGR